MVTIKLLEQQTLNLMTSFGCQPMIKDCEYIEGYEAYDVILKDNVILTNYSGAIVLTVGFRTFQIPYNQFREVTIS